jgi:hypothetical protein
MDHITTPVQALLIGLLSLGADQPCSAQPVQNSEPTGVVAGDSTVPLVPARWTWHASRLRRAAHDSARFVTHLGHASLRVTDGFAYATGVALRNGILEADVAADSQGAFFGLAFHVASPDAFEVIFFRPHNPDATVQYAPSFFQMNAWQLFPGPEYNAAPEFPQRRWVHLRVVIKGLAASLYFDTASTPAIEVHDLPLGSTAGTIGFWGRGGGGYISNIHYRPDTATYPLTPVHTFAPGAITKGWSLSQALPIPEAKPDVYPSGRALRWDPVQAEREGLILVGRYRQDPSVEPARPASDRAVGWSDGSQVVFARTTLVSDRNTMRKLWIGYSDDVVVYLNGHPLYEGRNSMSFRDPQDLGYIYPYADAVFLPLKKGKNELLLAVTESTAGWGFTCRLDQ